VISIDQARTLQGKTMLGSDGEKLGTIDTLYADREDGHPTFATVNTGLFGSKTSFVPLEKAEVRGDDLVVPYDKDLVKDAPGIDPDAELSPEEEDRLYTHYGVGGGTAATTTTGTTDTTTGTTTGRTDTTTGTDRGAGYDTSGPTTDDAMTRSEEHLQVGTQKTEAGRARLRKYVTTETETVQVPVSKERVTVDREPITDGNVGNATDGPAISEEEHEVVLHEEKPVVAKEAVPVERVRMGKEQVTEDVTVSEEVRKEQIDADGVYPDDAGTRSSDTSRP
jgi:uncharacterized protein (TIGR02271 family)